MNLADTAVAQQADIRTALAMLELAPRVEEHLLALERDLIRLLYAEERMSLGSIGARRDSLTTVTVTLTPHVFALLERGAPLPAAAGRISLTTRPGFSLRLAPMLLFTARNPATIVETYQLTKVAGDTLRVDVTGSVNRRWQTGLRFGVEIPKVNRDVFGRRCEIIGCLQFDLLLSFTSADIRGYGGGLSLDLIGAVSGRDWPILLSAGLLRTRYDVLNGVVPGAKLAPGSPLPLRQEWETGWYVGLTIRGFSNFKP